MPRKYLLLIKKIKNIDHLIKTLLKIILKAYKNLKLTKESNVII